MFCSRRKRVGFGILGLEEVSQICFEISDSQAEVTFLFLKELIPKFFVNYSLLKHFLRDPDRAGLCTVYLERLK